MECQYCKKTYSNIHNLNNHQRTTKACLILQNKLEKVDKRFDCLFCKEIFSSKYTLTRHISLCNKKVLTEKENEIHIITETREELTELLRKQKEEFNIKLNQLEEKIKKTELEKEVSELKLKEEKKELELKLKEEKKELELKLKEEKKELEQKLERELKREHAPQKISNKTINKHIDTQNITNNITIYQVMTPEHVLEVFQKHYSLDTLLGGQKALARFVNDEFLKKQATPLYVCGDRARQKFYMINDGKKEEDPDCENIIGL